MSEEYRNNQDWNENQNMESASGKNPKHDKDFKKILARAAAIALVVGVVGGGAFQTVRYLGDHYSAAGTVAQAAEDETETKETEVAKAVDGKAEMTTLSSKSDVSDGGEYSVKEVVSYAMPGMVAITNQGVQEVQDYFFGQTYHRATESTGSGVIIDENEEELLIATNNHVVSGAKTLTVCFTVDAEDTDDLVVPAEVKGTDPNHDLAVISVKLSDISADVKSKLKVAEIGSSENLELGEQVVAIGNALGYGQSVTSGWVSALDREVSVETENGGVVTNSMIQTDASINPGNSGGALLNMRGQLIGINSVKASAAGVEGMGYAIPIDTAMPIFDELKTIQKREIVDEDKRGFMGITPRDVIAEARQIYNMPAGAFVYEVSEGSAAAKAGVKKGDVITKMDGAIIGSSSDLFNRMQYYAEGDELVLTVYRAADGEYVEKKITMTLDKRPKDAAPLVEDYQNGGQQDGSQDEEGQDGSSGQEREDDVDPFTQIFPEFFKR